MEAELNMENISACAQNSCGLDKYKDIVQLYDKDRLTGRVRKVFPITYIQAVYDGKTGASLESILAQYNNVFLQFMGTAEATRVLLPKEMRRKGIQISYRNMEDEVIVEKCVNDSRTDDTHWGLSANWARIDELSLSGEISVSAKGTWIINGEDTGIKAVGPKGDNGLTPWLKTIDNKLYHSYDNKTWEPSSDYIAAWFRFTGTSGSSQAGNVGKIQISRDEGKTWTDLSGTFTNNLRISGYRTSVDLIPEGQPQGAIWAIGPTYASDDTAHTNPIYRLHVKDESGWVDNGQFTSIAAGVVQELGDSETEVISQKTVTKVTKSLRISIEPSISIRIEANSDGTVTLGKTFNENNYIEATLPEGKSIVWYPTASTNTYNIPQRGKLLWNLSTNTMRTVDNKTAILNEEIVLLSRNNFQIDNENPSPNTTFYNVLKGYTGGLLLPYIVTQLYERGAAWTSIGTCMISFGGDGTVKISDGWYLFYKYDGTSANCIINSTITFDLANFKQLVFNYYNNSFRVAEEYEQLSDKEILLLRYSAGVKAPNEPNRGSIFGYSDGIWLSKVSNEYRLSQTAVVSPSHSCQLNVKLDGTVTLNNRDVAASNSWYEFNLENGQRPLLYVTEENNIHVVPNFGALVYNRFDNSVRVITIVDNTNDLGSHDIILLQRDKPAMATPAYNSYAGNSLWGFVGGKLYPFIERALIISGNAYQCVSTAKISADNTGLINLGNGIHILYRFDGTYKTIEATGQSFTVPDYGKLVFNFNDNAIKSLGEYDDLSEFDVLLLKRGVSNSADSVDSWVGGLWMNKLLATKHADISGIEQQIASINTEIDNLQEQIASISPTVGFADLPVSDGSDIEIGYAYINSSDNTIRVKI